jgi:hypothetical protein
VAFATKTALALLGRRVLALDAEKEHLGDLLSKLVEKTAPELLALYGVGVGTAAACSSPPATTSSGYAPRRPGRTCAGRPP